ncbi:myoinhibiting peptide precursor isoform X2 [Oratosquilla oratoria]|uniref:myoinhibiting peptide precursor isoform X2 n=1 Tax=Oratosquilla oratoria TaxID=337810 RepID=UPI003F766061
MGRLQATQALWVLFALLLATRGTTSSPPVDSSSSIEGQAGDGVVSGHGSPIEKRSGGWSQLQGAWGKRGGWSQLHGAWGKRPDYPGPEEEEEEDLIQQEEPARKRANWNSLHGSWGKRGTWSNLQGTWGKRDVPRAYMDASMDRRGARWHDLQGSWGKRDWSQLHGAWGKRGYPTDEDVEQLGGAPGEAVAALAGDDDSEDEYRNGGAAVVPLQKRVWSKFVGSWGKRPDTLRPLSSRSANWSSLRGVDDEVAASDTMGLK